MVIFIIFKCCSSNDDTPSTSPPPQEEYTEEQIAEGKRINRLGLDYYRGSNGVEKDCDKALVYFRQASKLGNADAAYNAGMCVLKLGNQANASYYFFQAARSDHKRAFDELKSLAEEGIADAQNYYGLCFEYGYSTKVVYKNAAYWYYQAAKQGHKVAQYNIGLCYFYERGVKRNVQEALRWFKLSAQQGYEDAAIMIDKIV